MAQTASSMTGGIAQLDLHRAHLKLSSSSGSHDRALLQRQFQEMSQDLPAAFGGTPGVKRFGVFPRRAANQVGGAAVARIGGRRGSDVDSELCSMMDLSFVGCQILDLRPSGRLQTLNVRFLVFYFILGPIQSFS
jgi:hypothetical protein